MKMHNCSFIALLVIMWGITSPARAAVIAGYTFEGPHNGVDSVPANTGTTSDSYLPFLTHARVSASRVTAPGAGGAGSPTVRLGVLSTDLDPGYTSNVLVTSTEGLGDNNGLTEYFTLTILPNNAFVEMNFTNMQVQAARGGGSDRGFRVRSSLDGFTAELNGSDTSLMSDANGGSQRPTLTPYTVDLSGVAFQMLSVPIEFRFYPWSSAPNNTIEMDNLVFNGTVTPEAASLTLLLAGLVCLCGTRRRSQR